MADSYINQYKNLNSVDKYEEDSKKNSLTRIAESVESEKYLTLRDFEKTEMKQEVTKI